MPRKTTPPKDDPAKNTALVGTVLDVKYAEHMNSLHEATGRSRKSLFTEALDNLFAANADKIPGYGKSKSRKKNN